MNSNNKREASDNKVRIQNLLKSEHLMDWPGSDLSSVTTNRHQRLISNYYVLLKRMLTYIKDLCVGTIKRGGVFV